MDELSARPGARVVLAHVPDEPELLRGVLAVSTGVSGSDIYAWGEVVKRICRPGSA